MVFWCWATVHRYRCDYFAPYTAVSRFSTADGTKPTSPIKGQWGKAAQRNSFSGFVNWRHQPFVIDVLQAYNVIAQNDSKTTVRINEAVQRDSAALKTVAILTLTFLPATYVSVSRLERLCSRSCSIGLYHHSQSSAWVFSTSRQAVMLARGNGWYQRGFGCTGLFHFH